MADEMPDRTSAASGEPRQRAALQRIISHIHDLNPQQEAIATAEQNRRARESIEDSQYTGVGRFSDVHLLHLVLLPCRVLFLLCHGCCLGCSKLLQFLEAVAAAWGTEDREATLDYVYDAWWQLVLWRQRLGLSKRPPALPPLEFTTTRASAISHRNIELHRRLLADSGRFVNPAGVRDMGSALAKVQGDNLKLPALQLSPDEWVMVLLSELSERQLPRVIELPSERVTAFSLQFATASAKNPDAGHLRLSAFVFAQALEFIGGRLEREAVMTRWRAPLRRLAETLAWQLDEITADYFSTVADRQGLLKRLRGELSSGNPELRLAAIRMLRHMGSAEDAEILLTLYLLPPHSNHTPQENHELLRAARELTYHRNSTLRCA